MNADPGGTFLKSGDSVMIDRKSSIGSSGGSQKHLRPSAVFYFGFGGAAWFWAGLHPLS